MIGIEKKGLALTQVANVISAAVKSVKAIKSVKARRSEAVKSAAIRNHVVIDIIN